MLNALANEQMPCISHLRDFFALEDCSEDVARRFLGYLILTYNKDQKVIGYTDDTFKFQLPRLVQNGSFQRACRNCSLSRYVDFLQNGSDRGDFVGGIRNAHVMHGRVEAAHALWLSLYPDPVIHPTL